MDPGGPRGGARPRPGLGDGSFDDREGQVLIGADVRGQEGVGDAATPAAESPKGDPLLVEVAVIPAVGVQPGVAAAQVGAAEVGGLLA